MLLANAILRSPWRGAQLAHYNSQTAAEVERLCAMLTPPFAPNHMPRHPALGPSIAEEIKKLAPVYRLDLASVEAAKLIMLSERRMAHAFQHCRAPHPRMFFEFPEGQIGFMTEGDRDDLLVSIFGIGADGQASLSWQVRCNFNDPLANRTVSPFLMPSNQPDLVKQTMGGNEGIANMAVWYTASIWMFLTISGATVVEKKLTREGRLARHRRKPFAFGAIDSYNQVRLLVPGRQYHRASIQFSRGPGVRFHDVVGHWREKHVDDGGMMLRWIAAYWRGNPALGTVVKVRNIETRRRPKHDLPPPEL